MQNVGADRVLTRDRMHDPRRLQNVKPNVVYIVACDRVESGLISTSAVDPLRGPDHRDCAFPQVSVATQR